MKSKRLSEILSRLVDITLVNTNAINDFTVGSTILSIYEAFAMELEQYYMLGEENILWGIEQGVLNGFNFYKREAKRAYGEVTIEFHTVIQDDLIIPRGSQFDSIREGYQGLIGYETLEDHIVPRGTVIYKVDVYANQAGEIGNLPQNTINRMVNGIGNVKRVYNEEDFLTGTEEESLNDVKRRFHAFIESRGRATIQALDYGTRSVENVSGVYIKEQVGEVTVYAHDRNGNLSQEMIQASETTLETYRPAGIKLTIRPVVKTLLPVDLTITITDRTRITRALENQIEQVVREYLNQQTVSQELVLANLVQAIMNIDDELIYDVSVDNYTGNIKVQEAEIIRAGDVTITLV